MTAILRRELSAYFSSPIGYIYLFVFYVFSGFYFTFGSLLMNYGNLSGLFSFLITIIMFLIPILTMRLLSEDNKNKTDQALLTAPVSLGGLVLGKFLAALTVYLLGLVVTLVYAVIIAVWTPPNWPSIFANFVALAILGAALIAIGMFISSLTENQVIAAVGGFAVALGLMLLDGVIGSVQNPLLVSILSGLSFFSRFGDFTAGLFNFSSVLYFVSVSFLFIFFTVRVLEKRRWS
jgi:ABC-2 type transport system permease protein